MQNDQSCPCGTGLDYSECCLPLHCGKTFAKHATQLMRSRYSAFVKQEIHYIVETTALAQQNHLLYAQLLEWSQTTDWQSLDIIAYDHMVDKNHAYVEFKAHYLLDGEVRTHHENSFFVNHEGHWYFLDPTLDVVYGMKQPCICGSDKKFKHCCAKYL